MATRLECYLSHGEISNVTPGKVTGVLWMIGAEEPLILELEGNCHSDIAGCTLVFENPALKGKEFAQRPDGMPKIPMHQSGVAGDITASKKVPMQESVFEQAASDSPKLLNALSVEWYDGKGSRFVIETPDFTLYTDAPEWRMDAEVSEALLAANTKRFHEHIDAIARRISEGGGGEEFTDEALLNEFEWEERLKESDRITEAYMEALDKYQDSPDQESMISAAMGWNHGGESAIGWESDEDEDDFDSDAEDFWMEDDGDGDPLASDSHPLYERCHELSGRLHRDAQEKGLLDGDDESSDGLTPVQTLVFATMELSSKLAGALNGVNQTDPEPGLVVAWLKRGLPVLGRALGAANSAAMQESVPLDWVEKSRRELFDLRAGMLDLIQEFRAQLP